MKRLAVILMVSFVLANLLTVFLPQTIGMETTPSWASSGDDHTNACFGRSVASAGDVNGDGYSDVIIGAYLYNTGNSNAGKAYLYLGSSSGLEASASWTSSGDDQTGAYFGYSVASAGDVNNDSYDDVIIGAYGYNTANTDAGKAYLYLGSSSGLEASPSWTSSGDDQASAEFGYSVASAGDVNGDRYSDVIIGAYLYDTANSNAGKAYLYPGSSSGLQASPSWTSSGDDQATAYFGISVASAGDVNGDGHSDVIIGAHSYDTANFNAGKAYLYLGSSSGLQASPSSWTSSGDDQAYANFGHPVASAGDVNGDGYSDVIIGAHSYDTVNTSAGKAYLYLGSSSGLQASPSWTSSGDDQATAYFGISVASAGDVNGDGHSDVIIGAHSYDTVNTSAGKAYLYLGSSSGLQASPSWTSSGDDQESACYGRTVSSAGDVNGDGHSDVIIGAYWYDTATNTDAGKAYLYLGVDTTPPAAPTGLTAQDHPNDEGGAIDLNWNDNAEPDLDHYDVYRSTTMGGPYTWLAETTLSEYTDSTTTDGITYYYVVTASDGVPNESPSSDAAYGISADNLPPATPTGLTVASLRSGDLNITWNPNTDDTQTYSIYSDKTGTWALIANVTHPQNWYIDTGLTSGTTYYYKISAWDEIPLESLKSEVVHGVSSPMGSISGVVKDKDGNVVEGATVTIYEGGTTTNPVTSTTTNSDGEYSVDVPPGTYDVKVEESGYDVQWEKDVAVTADQTATTDMTLPVTSDMLGDYLWIILIVIIIILVIIIIALIARKKKPVEVEEEEKPVEATEEEE